MELLFTQRVTVTEDRVNSAGNLKLSAILQYAQEAAGGHCELLGTDWDTMAAKDMFWAVLRHRAEIKRLPQIGETLTLETWPLPTTRSAFPRALRVLDETGAVIFQVMSLWVLMNTKTRAMILPGRSGVDVPGMVRPDQIAAPGSLTPGVYANTALWQIAPGDLDQNGHVNNAKYLDRAEMLTEELACKHPREFTVCYLSETLPGEELTLNWETSPEGLLSVDGRRTKTDVPGGTERVFALQVEYE